MSCSHPFSMCMEPLVLTSCPNFLVAGRPSYSLSGHNNDKAFTFKCKEIYFKRVFSIHLNIKIREYNLSLKIGPTVNRCIGKINVPKFNVCWWWQCLHCPITGQISILFSKIQRFLVHKSSLEWASCENNPFTKTPSVCFLLKGVYISLGSLAMVIKTI